MNCIFCSIIEKKIPAKIVYESESVIAFHDINPQAPIHIIVIPKAHLQNILKLSKINATLLSQLLESIQAIVKDLKLEDNGFRIVTNTGEDGGQTVDHLHFHILGGRHLNWPPG